MLREPHKLSSLVHQAVTEPTNERYLSPIGIWEVMFLLEMKKIALEEDFVEWFSRTAQDLERAPANLTWQVVQEMPYILPNHKDPVDRFLAATAIAFDLILVAADQKLIGVPGLKVLANIQFAERARQFLNADISGRNSRCAGWHPPPLPAGILFCYSGFEKHVPRRRRS